MADSGARTVLVWPGTQVPAIPESTLREVYGARTIDPFVERAVLTIEYYLTLAVISEDKALEMMLPRIAKVTEDNVFDVINLLAKRGRADDFFNLATPSIDRSGAFREWLTDRRVPSYVIRHYASWNGLNPDLFARGFLFGIAESAATVVIDLVKLVKLVIDLHRSFFQSVVQLVTDVETGITNIRQQTTAVGDLFDGLVKAMDPTELPAKVLQAWTDWNTQFAKHLEAPDPFEAGRHLGRTAGDLWQLLTGFVALIKLLRVAARAALQYAPLLIGSIRRTTAEVTLLLQKTATVLTQIGRATIDALPRVGIGVLDTLFPPAVMKALSEGRTLLTHGNLTVMPVFRPAYATAFGQAGPLRTPLGFLVADQGRPVLMASASETLQSGDRLFDPSDVGKVLDDKFKGYNPTRAPRALSTSTTKVADAAEKQAQLAHRLETTIASYLQRVAWQEFVSLVRSGKRFLPKDLGNATHATMKMALPERVRQVAPGTTVRTEVTLSALLDEISASSPSAIDDLAKAQEIVNSPIARVLSRPHLARELDIIGIDKSAAARTEQAIAKALSEKFGWAADTPVGRLRSDALLFNIETKRLYNVDYTSSTNADRFEKLWRQVYDDLGDGFDGNWDTVGEAYKKAGKTMPVDVPKQMAELTEHAVRETVVRRVLMMEIFGRWHIGSFELLYDGFGKLYARLYKVFDDLAKRHGG